MASSQQNDTETSKYLSVQVKPAASVSMKIKRGDASWSYFYTLLGFALTIETGIASMFYRPWNFIGLLVIAPLTIYLILFSGWTQNKLIGWKTRYENAEH